MDDPLYRSLCCCTFPDKRNKGEAFITFPEAIVSGDQADTLGDVSRCGFCGN